MTGLPRLSRRPGPLPGIGIVHLGLGAFFRAHGSVCLAEAMAASGGDWGVAGVSLRSPAVRDALAPQGGVHTAVERGPQGETRRIVGTVQTVLVAPEDPRAVLDRMADPATRIVSLTVTEKGYCHAPATGRLNLDHPDIRHDLAELLPVSAPGFLVRALARRRAAGQRPFTVLSCDNLPGNGRVTRGVVLDLARAVDPGLADWIAAEGRFPSTMVDRIVPATTQADIDSLAAETGIHDAAPVFHEPFRQWVIEDAFVAGDRPDLAAGGAEMVADVTAHEHMKLRLLNGAHSVLAYLGFLAGHETIADTVADPAFAGFLRRLWAEEIIPATPAPAGVSLPAYAGALAKRFANPAIRHRTGQIAMDGSQKLPQRLLGTLAANGAAGRPSPRLVLGVAAWMRFVGGIDERGAPIDVRDPLAARLRALHDSADSAADRVAALLGETAVFDPAMARALAAPVTAAYARLATQGAHAAVAGLA